METRKSARFDRTHSLLVVLGALVVLAWPAAASAQAAPTVSPDTSGPVSASRPLDMPQVQASFLRRNPSAWSLFGLGLTKNGTEVGTGPFTLIPSEAVRGSKDAARHLRHARIYHALTLTFAVAAIGMVISGASIRNPDDRSSVRTSNLLLSGAIGSALLEIAFASGRDSELSLAVNAYNWDLVSGRLDRE